MPGQANGNFVIVIILARIEHTPGGGGLRARIRDPKSTAIAVRDGTKRFGLGFWEEEILRGEVKSLLSRVLPGTD